MCIRDSWTGEPYTDANGTVCRDARADAQRLVNYYRANYAAAVPLEGTKATIYTATYKGTEKITDDSQYVYTIKATGMYQVCLLYTSCSSLNWPSCPAKSLPMGIIATRFRMVIPLKESGEKTCG